MNAYSRKDHERKRPYTNAKWQRKKEQTTNACGKERKTKPQMLVAKNGCLIRQANTELTPNERNKTAETTSKPQTVAYLQA